MNLVYLQRKTNCLMAPMVQMIGKALSYSANKVMNGVTFNDVYATYVDGVMTWYGIQSQVDRVEKANSEAVIKDPSIVIKAKQKFMIDITKLNGFTKKVKDMEFDKLSNEELADIYERYAKLYENAYIWAEPLAWVIKERVTEYLKKIVNGEKLSTLLAPRFKSFVKREEEDLLRIAVKAQKGEDVDKEIEEHEEKYKWVPYDYGAEIWDKKHFLESLQKVMNSAEEELRKSEENFEKTIEKQKKLELEIDKKDLEIIKALRESIFLMDYKKEMFTQSHLHVRGLFEEIGERLGVGLRLMQFIAIEEIRSALVKGIDKEVLKQRHDFSIVHWDKDKEGAIDVVAGDEAKKFF